MWIFISLSTNKRRRKEKGVLLLLTLWISVVLAIIAYSLSYQVRLEMKLTKQFRQSAQARAVAQAGVAKAVVDLKNDLILDTSEGGARFDAEGDVWANPDDKTDVEFGPGKYSVLVIDKNSLININTARFEVLKELLITLDVEEKEAEKIAYAIIDWRDPDDKPAGGEGEKENTYYSSLIVDTNENDFLDDESKIVYRCKNEPFLTVEELLDVYGITPELFYGYNPEDKLAALLGEGEEIKDEERKLGLRDLVTVNNDNALNINTAPLEVLTAVIAAAGISDADPEGLAEEIVEYRRGGREKDIDNEHAFRTWQQLSEVSGFSPGMARRMYTVQRLTTRSNFFQIISIGTVGEVSQRISVDVVRSLETFNPEEDAEEDDESTSRYRRRRSDTDEETSLIREPTIRVIRWVEP